MKTDSNRMKAPRVLMPRWRHYHMKLDLANKFTLCKKWEMIDMSVAKKDTKSSKSIKLMAAEQPSAPSAAFSSFLTCSYQ